MAEVYYVGVDVGTASVRAALVTRDGLLKGTAEEPISIWEPQPDHYVQSSTEIWEKCCTVVKVGVTSEQWLAPVLISGYPELPKHKPHLSCLRFYSGR